MLTQHSAAPYLICHAPGRGVIARFHQDETDILNVVDRLIKGGSDGISLSPWLMRNARASGAGDTFLDWQDGELLLDVQQNLARLLKALKQRGINWVQIAPQFYGPNDPRENAWPSGDIAQAPPYYAENWQFLASLPAVFDAAGLHYLIDICPEVNDVYRSDPALQGKPNIGLQCYAKRLWVDATSWFYPNGRPPWNLCMSVIPGQTIDVLTEVEQGNPAPILNVHVYSNYPGGLAAGLSSVATAIPGRDVVVGETSTLRPGDEAVGEQLATAVEGKPKLRVVRVCPWPIGTDWKLGDPQITLAPPLTPRMWNVAGSTSVI